MEPNSQDQWFQQWYEAVNSESRSAEDLEMTRNDGSRLNVHLEIAAGNWGPPSEDMPNAEKLRVTLTDVSKLKEVEQQLRELNSELEERVQSRTADLRRRTDQLAEQTFELHKREQQFRMLAENVPSLFAYFDKEGRYRYVNHRFQELYGLSADQIVGHKIVELVEPENYRILEPHIELALQGEEQVYEADLRYQGVRHVFHVQNVPDFNETGEVQGFYALVTDITERKLAEEALQEREQHLLAILRAAPDAIVALDSTGTIQEANPATTRIFGYTTDELIGRNVSHLMPSYRKEHGMSVTRFLSSPESQMIGIDRELEGQHKDGHRFPIELAINQIDDSSSFIAIIRDISQRKELERQVVNASAEEQRRIGQDIHDGVGQELTGLRYVARTHSETLHQQESSEAPTAERIVTWLETVQGQLRLVVRQLIPVEVDEKGLTQALLMLAKRTTEVHDQTCTLECQQTVAISDPTLATHLYRIAQEAVRNAVRHAKARQITIRLEETEEEIMLQVIDDGIGLQAFPERVTRDGIGLRSMAYRAGLIGGQLSVNNREPNGAMVNCTVPKKAPLKDRPKRNDS